MDDVRLICLQMALNRSIGASLEEILAVAKTFEDYLKHSADSTADNGESK